MTITHVIERVDLGRAVLPSVRPSVSSTAGLAAVTYPVTSQGCVPAVGGTPVLATLPGVVAGTDLETGHRTGAPTFMPLDPALSAWSPPT
ncbi:MAG: hypothetical protein WB441_15950 [Nocardioidaceae bacterium]